MELRERRELAQLAIVSPAMLSLDLSQNEKEHLPLLAERSFLKPLKGAGLPIGKPEKLLCSSNSRKFWNGCCRLKRKLGRRIILSFRSPIRYCRAGGTSQWNNLGRLESCGHRPLLEILL